MKSLRLSIALFLPISWLIFASASAPHHHHHLHDEQHLIECLESSDPSLQEVIYTPGDKPEFRRVLDFYIRNLRFLNSSAPKPRLIVAPSKKSQVQTVIRCAKYSRLQMRVRSGGHDFEGSSYIAEVPFFILDINKFRSISVDLRSQTAWAGAGATMGEIYYAVHLKNRSLGVALGNWPTVCAGGFISGGGYGGLTRQAGIGADQVLDAIVVDANGDILDRESMGKDFFWAIRGGIGVNFVVILEYKLKLVYVSEKPSAFLVTRTLEENAVQLVYKSQKVVPHLPLDLSFSIIFRTLISNETCEPTVQASFICAYRGGGVDELLSIMDERFPELGVTRGDVTEILWAQFVPFHNSYPIDDFVHYLTSRISPFPQAFKAKSDFVRHPVPESGVELLMNKLLEVPVGVGQMEWTFWGGGIMDKIPATKVPFPHRDYMFIVFEIAFWNGTVSPAEVKDRINWLRELHGDYGKYVPNNPRPAYADYRDHDLGVNNPDGTTTVERARSTWGGPYFGVNFDRLVRVKSEVDSKNFFRNEQGFPVTKSVH